MTGGGFREGRTFTTRDVILTLQYLFAVPGAPGHLRSDNGPEFVAKEIQRWLDRASVNTLYVRKAGLWGASAMKCCWAVARL